MSTARTTGGLGPRAPRPQPLDQDHRVRIAETLEALAKEIRVGQRARNGYSGSHAGQDNLNDLLYTPSTTTGKHEAAILGEAPPAAPHLGQIVKGGDPWATEVLRSLYRIEAEAVALDSALRSARTAKVSRLCRRCGVPAEKHRCFP